MPELIFFSLERFTSDIANGDCCFICGAQRAAVPFNDEHVTPDWILRRFGLHGCQIQIPNSTHLRYGSLTVPCCVQCNSEIGDRFEKPMRALFAGGFEAVPQGSEGPWVMVTVLLDGTDLLEGAFEK